MSVDFLGAAARWSTIAVVGLGVLVAISGALVAGVLVAISGGVALFFNTRFNATVVESANDRAAQADQELVTLRKKLGPRKLDPETRHLILVTLQRDVPTDPVDIEFVTGSEPRDFAEELAGLLRDATWPVGLIGGVTRHDELATGLIVLVSDTAEVPTRAERLHAALTAASLAPKLVRSSRSEFAPDSVTLRVGFKE